MLYIEYYNVNTYNKVLLWYFIFISIVIIHIMRNNFTKNNNNSKKSYSNNTPLFNNLKLINDIMPYCIWITTGVAILYFTMK